jgi:hypothetical protein
MTDDIHLPPSYPAAANAATVGRITRDPTTQWSFVETQLYTPAQMDEYARAAVLLDRQQRAAPSAMQVGCEGPDGLLRIHAESETCDVCAPPAPSAEPVNWDSIALAAARDIALMWGQDRSQFVSKIQVRVIDALRAALEGK